MINDIGYSKGGSRGISISLKATPICSTFSVNYIVLNHEVRCPFLGFLSAASAFRPPPLRPRFSVPAPDAGEDTNSASSSRKEFLKPLRFSVSLAVSWHEPAFAKGRASLESHSDATHRVSLPAVFFTATNCAHWSKERLGRHQERPLRTLLRQTRRISTS
jgi:hypothetical protein